MVLWLVIILTIITCTSAQSSSCVNDPYPTNCSNYIYPYNTAKSAVTTMCSGGMKGMSVCSLVDICNVTTENTGVYCGWFSLFMESCAEMGMGSGPTGSCMDLQSMCATNTSVIECGVPILNLPSSPELTKNFTAMCNSMPGMTGCSCTGCTPLEQYSQVCLEMNGDMEQCYEWNIFCTKIPDWTLCANSPGNIIPLMKMYFHWGFYDYILFKGWIPYDGLTYGISILAIFILALLHEGFRVLKINTEIRWKMTPKRYSPINTMDSSLNTKPQLNLVYPPFDLKRDSIRSIYRMIDVVFHYFIMLVAMTFNAGLFLAIVFGYGVGHLLFSRLSRPKVVSGSSLEDEDQCH